MVYKGLIEFPAEFHELAWDIGKEREDIIIEHAKKYNLEQVRGEKNLEYNQRGVLGELIGYLHLEKNNINHTRGRLVEDIPPKKCDVVINDMKRGRLDIKTARYDKKTFNITCYKHDGNPKGIDRYWLIWTMTRTKALHFLADFDNVSQWDVGEGFCYFYYYPIEKAISVISEADLLILKEWGVDISVNNVLKNC